MTVKFHHPPTASSNPLKDFEPGNYANYPVGEGVYIFGFRGNVDGKLVFVPLYVGIAKDLRQRLWQHFCEERSGGNSKWYVFDYAKALNTKDFNAMYDSMRIADQNKKNAGNHLPRFSDNLVWFNDRSFFNNKLDIVRSSYVANSGVQASILRGGDLDRIGTPAATDLKARIILSKAVFDEDYYFLYTTLEGIQVMGQCHPMQKEYNERHVYMNVRKNGPGKHLAERIELATKEELLRCFGLYTCAKASGKSMNFDFDFSDVVDSLIRL
jgi:hypothetical protein